MIKKIAYATTIVACILPVASSAAYRIYGQVQAEINVESIDGIVAPQDGFGVDDDAGRSRWGIKAHEKLSSGMTAFAKLEFSLDPADNGAEGNRDQYVGIKGGFGSISIGRQVSPYKYHGGVKYDPFVTTHIQARRGGGMSGNGNGFGHNGFVSNSIVYKSPVLHGLSVDLLVMPDETNGGGSSDMDYSIGVKYKLGPMEMVAAHNRLNTAENQTDEKMTKIGGKIKWGIHTLTGQFEWIENSSAGTGNNAGSATGASFFGPYSGIGTCPATPTGGVCNGGLNGGTDGTIWFAGYQMKIENFTIAASFGGTDADNQPGEVGNETFYWAAGLIHHFSKKFRMFVGWTESDTNLDYGSGEPSDRDVWTIGMRKDF